MDVDEDTEKDAAEVVDIRWCSPGAYMYGADYPRLTDRMAFPNKLAQQCIVCFPPDQLRAELGRVTVGGLCVIEGTGLASAAPTTRRPFLTTVLVFTLVYSPG